MVSAALTVAPLLAAVFASGVFADVAAGDDTVKK